MTHFRFISIIYRSCVPPTEMMIFLMPKYFQNEVLELLKTPNRENNQPVTSRYDSFSDSSLFYRSCVPPTEMMIFLMTKCFQNEGLELVKTPNRQYNQSGYSISLRPNSYSNSIELLRA